MENPDLIIAVFILANLATGAICYIAGWLDRRDHQRDQYRVRARLLSDVPEWVRRRTTEVQQR